MDCQRGPLTYPSVYHKTALRASIKNDAWTSEMTHYMVMCKPLYACQSSFQIQDPCQQLPPQPVKDTKMREEKIKEKGKEKERGQELLAREFRILNLYKLVW